MKHLIDFNKLDWTIPAPGVRYRAFVTGNQRIRLIEFAESFSESDWCRYGHAGYIIDGECDIDFCGIIEHFKKGDTIFIPQGEEDKHKVLMGKDGWVQMLLFESI